MQDRLEAMGKIARMISPLECSGPIREIEEVISTHPGYAQSYWALVELMRALDESEPVWAMHRAHSGLRRCVDYEAPPVHPHQRRDEWSEDDALDAACMAILNGRALAPDEPQKGRSWQALALELVATVEPRWWARYGNVRAVEIAARATANLSNSIRIEEDPTTASRVLEPALQALPTCRNPFVVAEISGLEASVRKDQQRFEDAKRAIARAIAEIEALDPHLVAVYQLQQATILRYEGVCGAEDYARLATNACESLDRLRSPWVLQVGRFNEATYWLEAEEVERAERILAELPPFRSPYRRALVDCLEGRTLAARGELDEAARKLRSGIEVFLAHGRDLDASYQQLHLAACQAGLGERSEAVETILAASWIFEARGVAREAGVTLSILREAELRTLSETEIVSHIERLSRLIRL